jgi:hypothetical protein
MKRMTFDNGQKRQPITSGFARAGVYARSNICAYLQVHRPPKPL